MLRSYSTNLFEIWGFHGDDDDDDDDDSFLDLGAVWFSW
jgi:hypothetical protein